MTAEIAILNKSAVALAADSAGTVDHAGSVKIYNTTNKLFGLSKYEPIAIMVYGNAEFMGVPWETLIKLFREDFGERALGSVREYGAEFLSFLESRVELFNEPMQSDYLYWLWTDFLQSVRSELDEQVRSAFNDSQELSVDELNEILKDLLKSEIKSLQGASQFVGFTPDLIKKLAKKYDKEFRRGMSKVFENFPLSDTNRRLLRKAYRLFISRFRGHDAVSGIVIAGFGRDEVFPALVSYLLDGMMDNKLRYLQQHDESVTVESGALIVPFAQRDMIHTFMEGIDPRFMALIKHYLQGIFTQYPEILRQSLAPVLGQNTDKVITAISSHTQSLYQDFIRHMSRFQREKFVEDIIYSVAVLPKDELAALAESLINLTSLRRRMSHDAETVGGPVDVAVISKGDGLVWIRRKHYFPSELNHAFFNNYFRRTGGSKNAE